MVKQSHCSRLETNSSEKCENHLSVKGSVLKSSAQRFPECSDYAHKILASVFINEKKTFL